MRPECPRGRPRASGPGRPRERNREFGGDRKPCPTPKPVPNFPALIRTLSRPGWGWTDARRGGSRWRWWSGLALAGSAAEGSAAWGSAPERSVVESSTSGWRWTRTPRRSGSGGAGPGSSSSTSPSASWIDLGPDAATRTPGRASDPGGPASFPPRPGPRWRPRTTPPPRLATGRCRGEVSVGSRGTLPPRWRRWMRSSGAVPGVPTAFLPGNGCGRFTPSCCSWG